MSDIMINVPSHTHERLNYSITISQSGEVKCSCPAYVYQDDTPSEVRTCKHINALATPLINQVYAATHADSPYATKGLDSLDTVKP